MINQFFKLNQCVIYFIQYQKQMQTRSKRRVQQQDVKPNHDQKQKSKKQLLNQKKKASVPEAQGKNDGKKKIKKDELASPQKSRRDNNKPIRVTQDDLKPIVKDQSVEKKLPPQAKRGRKKVDKSEDKERQEETKLNKSEEVKKTPDNGKKDINNQKSEQKEEIQTIQFKGKVPIDQYCNQKNSNYHILEHLGKIYSATLNQTNIQGNNNKFYIIQVIQNDKNPEHCFFYTRWGRVGAVGQISCIGPSSISYCIKQYNKKYHQKHNKGDYRQIELNYIDDEEEQKKDNISDNKDKKKEQKADFDQSKLPNPVKKLIELIFDLGMMNRQMTEIGFNVSRMPLGRLSKDNILKGYKLLEDLLNEIKGKKDNTKILELTNEFYSFIPHNVGFNKMQNFHLDNQVKVKKKIEMLEALAEIKIATNILKSNKEDDNVLDSNYKKLNRDIRPINRGTEEYKILNDYLQTTHAKTHHNYSLQLQDLFSLQSQVEDIRYTKDIHNKVLLWHGSRLTNFVGILSQGLRIAPPQAPVTGYMFGKGVYFADMSSKSANYCFTSTQSSTGILLLCQVALGNMNEKFNADYYASNLPPGKHSTKGMGKTAPNPDNAVKLEDGVIVPMGPGENTSTLGCSLQYNEFIVYDIAQIKIRYLLRTKFNYKNGF